MNVEFINPFILSTVSVFRTMLHCEVKRIGLSVSDTIKPDHEITGIVGLSGRASGDAVISFDREVAIGATEALLGEQPQGIEESVIDTVGELTNMIVGHAKASLEEYDIRIALPTVITGRNHSIRFISRVKPIAIPFECQWGAFTLEIALGEDEQAEARPTSLAGASK